METQNIDTKTFERIGKLLNLARDGGATEAEASLAMDKAQEIMRDNNLTMAQIELKGSAGSGDAARLKTHFAGKAMYGYQRNLMQAIANANFCYLQVINEYRGRRYVPVGYNIIGRQSNVVSVQNLFSYLNSSAERAVTPHLAGNHERISRWALSFKEGFCNRLSERLQERHDKAIAEQSRKAREANAASRHPAASGSNALVVVMQDYAQSENDRNDDFRHGWAPGTAAAKRAEQDALADGYEERAAKRAAKYAAEEAARRASLTDKQRKAEDDKAAREEARSKARWEKQWEKDSQRLHGSAYAAGHVAGNSVGLDDQIERGATKKSIA